MTVPFKFMVGKIYREDWLSLGHWELWDSVTSFSKFVYFK